MYVQCHVVHCMYMYMYTYMYMYMYSTCTYIWCTLIIMSNMAFSTSGYILLNVPVPRITYCCNVVRMFLIDAYVNLCIPDTEGI